MSRSRRAGFTLIELVVYLSLVTVGLLLVGSVEMTAQRAADMQQALIEVQWQGDAFLAHLRRDVEAARRVERTGDALLLTLGDGRRVRWTPGSRELEGAAGRIDAETFPAVKSWTLQVEPATGRATRVTVRVRLEQRGREAVIVRERTRTATTRLEVPGE